MSRDFRLESLAAAVFDLDDTLYPISQYHAGAIAAVADRAGELGLDALAFRQAMTRVMQRGSRTGHTIDDALELVRPPEYALNGLADTLVATFRSYTPTNLSPFPGVASALLDLHSHIPLACLTDGRSDVQRAKLSTLGLSGLFDVVVVSGDLPSSTMQKPNPYGFRRTCELLGVGIGSVVIVGDRPDGDIALATACGVPSTRVRQGEHYSEPSPDAWAVVSSVPAAVALLLDALRSGDGLDQL